MAIAPLTSVATQLPTTPMLPSTGQVGWSGGGTPFVDAPTAAATTATGAAGVAAPQSFGQTMTRAIDSLQGAQAKADRLAVRAATGDLTNVHDYTIAATQAALATELTVAVRNKAVESFNQIMNMGV